MVTGSTRLGSGAEFDLIRRVLEQDAQIRSRHGAAPRMDRIRLGPGDDCAIVIGDAIAISTDASIEDVHFRRAWLEPAEIGYRAVAAALSDLAGVGAEPIGLLVTLAVHRDDGTSLAEKIMAGASDCAARHLATLLGGDVSASPGPIVIDVTVVGECDRPLRRSGARPGDEVWVSGALGGAAAAVLAWNTGREPDPAARAAFARPAPRLREALWLLHRGLATAGIDLSDGLAGDAGHIAAASGVGIEIEAEHLPVHRAASAVADGPDQALALALGGGEDYELCLTSPPGALAMAAAEFVNRFGVPLTRVGAVSAGAGVRVIDAAGRVRAASVSGYVHLGDEPAAR